MAMYVQLAKLDFPLGGVGVIGGYPIEQLRALLDAKMTKEQAIAKLSYTGQMNFFIYHGKSDNHFPYKRALGKYKEFFRKVDESSSVKALKLEAGLGHKVSKKSIVAFWNFIHKTETAKDETSQYMIVSNRMMDAIKSKKVDIKVAEEQLSKVPGYTPPPAKLSPTKLRLDVHASRDNSAPKNEEFILNY